MVFAAVLFVPALSTYFGLTGPGPAVFYTVLPALAAWFVVLSLVLRLRLLDRILKLDQIHSDSRSVTTSDLV